jgi:hypothetical protein
MSWPQFQIVTMLCYHVCPFHFIIAFSIAEWCDTCSPFLNVGSFPDHHSVYCKSCHTDYSLTPVVHDYNLALIGAIKYRSTFETYCSFLGIVRNSILPNIRNKIACIVRFVFSEFKLFYTKSGTFGANMYVSSMTNICSNQHRLMH